MQMEQNGKHTVLDKQIGRFKRLVSHIQHCQLRLKEEMNWKSNEDGNIKIVTYLFHLAP